MARRIKPDDILERDGTIPSEMRARARAAGYPFYRGLLCRHEHPDPRRTTTGECLACIAARHRAWKKRHPAKARAETNALLNALGKPLVLEPSVVSTSALPGVPSDPITI